MSELHIPRQDRIDSEFARVEITSEFRKKAEKRVCTYIYQRNCDIYMRVRIYRHSRDARIQVNRATIHRAYYTLCTMRRHTIAR